MGRKRKNNVYRHFMLHEDTRTSTCLICYKTLNSYHGSNLLNHLKFMHKIEYEQVLALNKGNIPLMVTPPKASPNSNDDDSNSDPGLEVDVDKFFKTERGANRAKCDICQDSIEIKGNSLLTHLKREHPKILKPDESDAEDPDDSLYQEVVYLYDSDSKSPKNIRPMKLPSSTPLNTMKQKMKPKLRQFNTSIENRKRPRPQETVTGPPVEEFNEELENFGKYVTCLMKTVPKDLCTQLQMEIINLIMTAKIRHMAKSDGSTSLMADKLDTVTASSFNLVTMDTSKLDHSSMPSPESNVSDMNKTD